MLNHEMLRCGKYSAPLRTTGVMIESTMVMVSSYLKQPLRMLEQAQSDRAQPQEPSAVTDHATGPRASGHGQVDLLVHLLSGGGQAGDYRGAASAGRSPQDRRRAP